MRFVMMVSAVLLMTAAVGHGATRYIDARDGDDRGDGLHAAHAGGTNGPWQTLARVSALELAPGDELLLRRDRRWQGRLHLTSPGTPGRPIRVAAYGTGADPIIDSTAAAVNNITLSASHITIRDLDCRRAAGDGIGIAVEGGCYGIILESVVISDCGDNGILINKGGSDIQLRRIRVHGVNNSGIALMGSARDKLSNVLIEDCEVIAASSNDGLTIHEDAHNQTAGTNFMVRRSRFERCGEQGIDITTGSYVSLWDNTTVSNREGGILIDAPAHHVVIYSHYSLGEPARGGQAVTLSAPYVTITHSTIEDSRTSFLSFEDDAKHIEVSNNMFMQRERAAGQATIDFVGEVDHIVVKDNIIFSLNNNLRRAMRFLHPSRPPDHGAFTIDHNRYWGISPEDDRLFYSAETDKSYNLDAFQFVFKRELDRPTARSRSGSR